MNDVGVHDSRPYIVSEYVQGPSLDQLIRREGPRSPDSLVRLAIATAAALNGIHQTGIVHPDFKPANVLLAPDDPRVSTSGSHVPSDGSPRRGAPRTLRPSCRPNRSKAVRQVQHRTSSTGARRCTSRRPVARPSTVRPSGPSRTRSSTPTRTSHGPPPLRELVQRAMHKTPHERPTAPQPPLLPPR
ncbi:protein kinase [Nonomuraea sp. NN258]|nr:protein kinase [Nonomuraea antri]